jgi:hypothetical protein
MKNSINLPKSLLPLVLAASCALAHGQSPSPIANPLLTIMDVSTDTATLPLLEVAGGTGSSTQGIEVTSQTTGTGGALGSLTLQPAGYGGLTLLQTGAATSTGGQNSPMLSLCAQQLTGTGSGTSTPQCWNLQVLGGGNTTMTPNPQDVVQLTRTGSNATNNFTFEVPGAMNFAALGQLTVGSVPSSAVSLSLAPVTIVGGFTSNTTTGQFPIAGALQLFPGFLNPLLPAVPNPDARSLEGPLQIGMAVKGNGTQGLLACYSATPGTGQACGSVTSPLLGVYFTVGSGSTMGSNGVITPPGRASVNSNGSTTWPVGAEVCRDPSNPSEAITAPSGACPLGQAVGVAVGDSTALCPTGCTSHLVDLDFSDQGVGSSGYWSAGPLNSSGSVTVLPNGNEYAYAFYIPSVLASSKLVLDVTTADNSSDTYSFGILNSSGIIVAYTTAQSFTTAQVYVVPFFEGTVTLPPGKYYFAYTGTGSAGG